MIKFHFLITSILFVGFSLFAAAKPEMPGFVFEANQGQTDPAVRFLARTQQATVFITSRETVFHMRKNGAPAKRAATVHMTLAGGEAKAAPPEALPGSIPSAIIDSWVGGPHEWRQNIPAYDRIIRRGVYDGIDLVYRKSGNARQLEYDFVLRPGANPAKIRMQFAGAKRVAITADGDLRIQTPEGTLIHRKPVATQRKQRSGEIHARFRMLGETTVGFDVTGYDSAQELVIDPVVAFREFYGGDGDNSITAVQDFAIAGYTNSAVFPGVAARPSGGYDAFFMSLSPTPRIAYVGGSGDDKAFAVAVRKPGTGGGTDDFDYAFGGETDSPDFPRTLIDAFSVATPQEPKRGAGKDAFYVLVSGTNVAVQAFGGSGDERIRGLSFNGGLVAVGETNSPDLPVSPSALQTSHGGGWDGFILWQKVDPIQTSPVITYWGGSGDDRLTCVSGAFVGGSTNSDDLATANAFQTKRAGGLDGVLLWMDGSSVEKQAPPRMVGYFGGTGDDEILSISSVPRRLALGGVTGSRDLPAADSHYGGGSIDGFLAMVDVPDAGNPSSDIPSFVMARYVGGSGNDRITGVLQVGPDVYVSGVTSSTDLTLTDAIQSAYGGGASDAFLGGYSQQQLQPFLLTYVGGTGIDEAAGVGLDLQGQVFIAGRAASDAIESGGQSKGFTFGIGPLKLYASVPAYLAKDSYAYIQLPAFRLPQPNGLLRIKTSDASRVALLSGLTFAAGQLEMAWTGEPLSVGLVGLADEGEAEITIAVDGLPEFRATVKLLPLERAISAQSSNGSQIRDRLVLHNYTTDYVELSVVHFVKTDRGNVKVLYPRPGIRQPVYSFEAADPEVVRIENLAGGRARVNGSARGATRIALCASTLGIDVIVEGPVITFKAKPVSGLLTTVEVSPTYSSIRSLDLDAAWLSLDGVAVAEFAGTALPIVGGPAGSIARIRVTAQGGDQADFSIPVEAPFFAFDPAPFRVPVAAEARIPMRFGDQASLLKGQANGKPDTKAVFRFTSSDPSVLRVSGPPEGPFRIFGERPGEAVLTAEGPPGFQPIEGRDSIRVIVFSVFPPDTATLNSMVSVPEVVGKDLQAGGSVARSQYIGYQPFTVTSSDPSRLLVSANSATLGTASESFHPSDSFYLQSLADSGEVAVTFQISNFPPVIKTVRLTPSFAVLEPSGDHTISPLGDFIRFSVRFSPASTGGPVFWTSSVLRPYLPVPIPSQTPLPGIDGSTRLRFSDPSVGQIVSSAWFEPLAVGVTTIELESAHFPVLPGFGKFTVNVRPAAFPFPGLGNMLLGKGTMASFLPPASVVPNGARMMWVLSSDPSKLLVAPGDGHNPASSIYTPVQSGFKLIGMSDTGVARVSIISLDFPTVEFDITLAPAQYTLGAEANPSIREVTTPRFSFGPKLVAGVSVYNPNLWNALPVTVAPTASEVAIPVTSSNEAVATASPTTIRIGPLSPAPIVTASPMGYGKTTIELKPPPPLDLGSVETRQVTVEVASPGLSLPSFNLPRNTQSWVAFYPRAATETVVTSSDPSKLLLARAGRSVVETAGPGQASLTLPPGEGFIAQALSDSGEVTIEARPVASPPARAVVRLVPLEFGLIQDLASPNPTPGVKVEIPVTMEVPFDRAYTSSYRTGADPVQLILESSDPSVVVVEVPSITFPQQTSFTVRTMAPGSATLTLHSASTSIATGRDRRKLTVTAPAAP